MAKSDTILGRYDLSSQHQHSNKLMKPHDRNEVFAADARRDTVNRNVLSGKACSAITRWFPAIALSVLLHIIISVDFRVTPLEKTSRTPVKSITLVLKKPPAINKPLLTKKPVTAWRQLPKISKINIGAVSEHKKTSPVFDDAAKRNHGPAAKDRLTPKPESSARRPVYRDWHAMTKAFVQEKLAGDLSRKQQQQELWLKAPSIMHGAPPDHFDKQDKAAMLVETEHPEKQRLNISYRKSLGLGIKLGNLCSLGDTGDKAEKGPFRCHW